MTTGVIDRLPIARHHQVLAGRTRHDANELFHAVEIATEPSIVDSGMCPMDVRRNVWQRLATDMKPAALKAMTRETAIGGRPDAFATLLSGAARGRLVVKL